MMGDDEVENLLTQELLKLSTNDRNAMHEEIHGVGCLAIPETPELLSKSLQEFQQEIDRTEKHDSFLSKKKAYNMILLRREKEMERNNRIQQNHQWLESEVNADRPSMASSIAAVSLATMEQTTCVYTNNHYALDDDDFRLRFLRVELFDVPKAVTRFLNYLNFVHEFWGEIALERPVYMKDVLKDKGLRSYLKKGFHQVLPFPDRSGRKVRVNLGAFLNLTTNMPKKGVDLTKIMFYITDAATRDCVESQRLGLVNIFEIQNWENFSVTSREQNQLMNKLTASVPARYASLHICAPDIPFFRSAFRSNLIMTCLNAVTQKLRIRFTFGTKMECRYKMKSYGIPIELYPLTETENIKTNIFNQWIKTRQLLDDKDAALRGGKRGGEDDLSGAIEAADIVECPCLNDVVFRQGSSSLDNPGNAIFRLLVLKYFEDKEPQTYDEQKNTTLKETYRDPNGNATYSFHRLSDHTEPLPAKPATTTSRSSYGDSDDRVFCDWLIHEIEVNRKGRFLNWDRKLGSWVHVKTDTKKGMNAIKQKIMIFIYNTQKRLSSSGTQRNRVAEHITVNKNSDSEVNYQFIEGGKRSPSPDQYDCFVFDCGVGGSNARKKHKI